jgi:hypothetical protein
MAVRTLHMLLRRPVTAAQVTTPGAGSYWWVWSLQRLVPKLLRDAAPSRCSSGYVSLWHKDRGP